MDEIFQLLDYLGIQSQSTIQTYARLAQRRHLKKGECLYYGGEDSTNLYFLISGILRGFTVSAGGKEYTECILHKYGHAHIGMIGMDNRQEFKLNKNLEALTEADLIYFDVRPIIKELPNSIEFLRVYVKKLEEFLRADVGGPRDHARVRAGALRVVPEDLPEAAEHHAAQGCGDLPRHHARDAQPYPGQRNHQR